jgi:hypothetical protein
MNRHQIGSPGLNDFYIDDQKGKGIMVGDDMIIKVFQIDEKGRISNDDLIESDQELYCVHGSSLNGRVVFAGDDNKAFTSQITDLSSKQFFAEYKGKVLDIALTHGGHRACLVGDDKDAVIYDFDLQRKLTTDSSNICSLISCAWSADGLHFAVVGRNAILSLYEIDMDFTQIKQVHQWKISEKDIKDDYPHGMNPQFVGTDKLIVGGKDRLQLISKHGSTWTYSTCSGIKHADTIYYVASLRDNFIATVGADHKVNIWNLTLELKLNSLSVNYKCCRIRFLPSNDILAILDEEGQIFTVDGIVKAGHQSMKIEPEVSNHSAVEESEALPKSDKQDNEEVEEPVRNRMDEEKKNSEVKSSNPRDEDSSFVADYAKGSFKFDSHIKKNNQNLVYDEADEEDMNKNAGLFDDEVSRPHDHSLPTRKNMDKYREEQLQKAFIPGSTSLQNKRCFICYNMYGKVVSRSEGSNSIIDVEYSLGNLSKVGFLNNYNYTMASINYRGVLLASTGVVIREDEYVDETIDELKRLSTLFFCSATSKNEWMVTLNQHENITNVALGMYWVAAYTNKKIIRIFGPEGIETDMIGFHEPVIGMCFYENLLAIVYHSSLPFSGNQCSKVRIINLSSKEVVLDSTLILSNDSKIRWFGFSEEGIFYVQDTKYMVWGQQNEHVWTPVFDGAKEANMWILGISEQNIISIRLQYGELEPLQLVNYLPMSIPFRPPLTSKGVEAKDAFLNTLKHSQEKLRNSYFGNMKKQSIYGEVPNFDDPMTVNRATIKTEEELEKLVIEADKQWIELARKAALRDNYEAAIYYGLQLQSPKTLDNCLRLFEGMGKGKLAQQLRLESEKLGALQYKYRGGNKQYIPQFVYIEKEVET